MIDYIGTVMADKLLVKLNNLKSWRLLFGDSTDATMFEKEVSYVKDFDPTPLGSDEVKIIKVLFALSKVYHSHADGVKKKPIKDFLEKNSKFNILSLRIKWYISFL